MEQPQICKSCDTPLQGKFCHACGEKLITAEDKSVKRWLGELFSSIWMLDGKLFKTLKYLIFRPAQLASDYVAGKRKPYVRPLNIFLIANILYFLSPTFDTFKTTLHSQMTNMPYKAIVEYAVDVKLEKKGLDLEEFTAQYDRKTVEVSKLILIVLAPLLGFLLYALFRKQGLYLSDSFGLALQYWAFFMLMFIVFLPYLNRLVDALFDYVFLRGEIFISISALVVSGFYLFFQLKPWKGEKWPWYIAKLLVLLVAFIPILTGYRFILFWATWLAL